jgi:Fic family protein
MHYGLQRLDSLPLCLRLLREIHGLLMAGTRGGNKTPGEFRETQNWIGGRTLSDAVFIPPPKHEMHAALDNLEHFLHDSGGLDPLIVSALAHAQFETIHPLLDGNGRMGRLLITFLLCHEQVLQRPVLYLSHYLKQHRASYYDRLMAIRMEGDWEGWLRFFLTGVAEVAREAEQTAQRIVGLREEIRLRAQTAGMSASAFKLLDYLFEQPIISVNAARDHLQCSYQAANGLIKELTAIAVLVEVTGGSRNRIFRFSPYLDLFQEVAIDEAEIADPQQTLY